MSDPAQTPRAATDELLQAVYVELHGLASEYLSRERLDHTLQPTALVHEAYLRLSELDRLRWKDRAHFLAAAAGAIRRVLIDHARARATAKRARGQRVTLSAVDETTAALDADLLALEEALGRLAAEHERKAKVVELRWFGGLTIDEVAAALGISTTTVENDWTFARAWLRTELGGG